MLKNSLEEYEEICIQTREASGAVMRYSAGIFALSGAALIALLQFTNNSTATFYTSFFDSKSSNDADLTLAFSLIILCSVTQLLQLIVNYKCDSHNRLAAYRNLIASEKFKFPWKSKQDDEKEPETKIVDLAVSFDVCMDHLNYVYGKKEFDFRISQDIYFARKGIFKGLKGDEELKEKMDSDGKPIIKSRSIEDDEIYFLNDVELQVAKAFPENITFVPSIIDPSTNQKPPSHDTNYGRLEMQFVHFIRNLFFISARRGSWSFPSYINAMLTFIVVLESLSSNFYFINFQCSGSLNGNLFSHLSSIDALRAIHCEIDIYLFVYGLLCLMFTLFFLRNMKLFLQISMGSRRINSYFRQFLPFRLLYLKEIFGGDVEPYYIGTPWKKEKQKCKKRFLKDWTQSMLKSMSHWMIKLRS